MGNDSTQLCPLSCMAPEEWLSHDNNPYPGLVGNKKYIHFLPKFLSVYLSANFFSLKFWSCVTFCLGNKTKQKKEQKVLTLYFDNIFFLLAKWGEMCDCIDLTGKEQLGRQALISWDRCIEDPYQHWHFIECLGWLNHFWETNVFVALKYKKKTQAYIVLICFVL